MIDPLAKYVVYRYNSHLSTEEIELDAHGVLEFKKGDMVLRNEKSWKVKSIEKVQDNTGLNRLPMVRICLVSEANSVAKGIKKHIYRYNGDPSRDESVLYQGTDKPSFKVGNVILRNEKKWKVYVIQEDFFMVDERQVPLFRIFLTDKYDY